MLKENKETMIMIDGYADNTGTASYNKALSARRAKVVKVYLIKHGVKAGQMAIHGNGSSSPVAPNATSEGRAQNRRVEIKVK